MKKVILKPIFHQGQECIGLFFEINFKIQGALRKTGVVTFSKTNPCWYAPMSKENYNKIFFALKGLAEIEQSALHRYLADKKKKAPPKQITSSEDPTDRSGNDHSKLLQKNAAVPQPIKPDQTAIHAINAHILPAMRQALVLKSYSPSTIRTYINEVGVFLRTIKHHPADQFTTQRIKDYLQYCAEKLRLTENTLHSRMNALKFYYEQVLKKEKLFWDIPRPKKVIQLPKVISKEEMVRLLKAIENLKHKTMIMLGYACGLRVSEITGLEMKDIDENRRLLFIRKGKGEKRQDSQPEPRHAGDAPGIPGKISPGEIFI